MMNERTTFTLNNAEYIDTMNGRYYKVEDGKKTRISKAAYEEAFEAYTESLREEETNEQTEDEQDSIEYRGYKITGDDNIGWVAIDPQGSFAPTSFATLADAKKAVDEDCDLKAEKAFNEKASGKPEKTQKTTKVQKDSKKAKDAKKAKEKAPKAKKVPEGGAEFEIDDLKVILTAKQVDFIKHLPDTDFWENGIDSKIWVDCLCDDIKGQFEGKPMTVGAMISTLCEKGLGLRAKEKINNRKATSFCLTELGKQVAQKLGLN